MYILPTIGWRVDSGPSLDAGWAPHLAPEHIRSIASKMHQGFRELEEGPFILSELESTGFYILGELGSKRILSEI